MRKSANFAVALALSLALPSGLVAMSNPWVASDWEFQETGSCLDQFDFWSASDWEAREKNWGTLCEWSQGQQPGQAQAARPPGPPQQQAPAPTGEDRWRGARTFQENEGGVPIQGRIAMPQNRNDPVHMQLRAPGGPNTDNAMRAVAQRSMRRACGPQSRSATTLSNEVVSRAGGNITREMSFRCVF